jgi:stage II sporulation protein D
MLLGVDGFAGTAHAQSDITDADLAAASGTRTVRLGSASGAGRPATIPLEVYVARVLAGEAEPRAAEGAQRALAIAIRTFALVNAGRHAQNGFDLCDSTHCQVPRAATALTRRAAFATAGQILTRNGRPAEVFYSASCGGHTESADQVWPGADYPYMPAVPDEVHGEDVSWTLVLTLQDIQRALRSAGFEGELTAVSVDDRNASGRATRLRLTGLRPDSIAGDRFRAVLGATRVRSTAFSIELKGGSARFTGRGYGHGVGMCVIGAGRRAGRGDSVEAILAKYFPGLTLTPLDRASGPAPVSRGSGAILAPPAAAARPGRGGIAVDVGPASGIAAPELMRLARQAHDDLARTLGSSVAPITVRVHESIESFRTATGRPWWVSAVSNDTSIDLVPGALLAQRDGVDVALRVAVAEILVSAALRGRPAWVRVGAARYFGRGQERLAPNAAPPPQCPSDAELDQAVSAAAQRDAEARAEWCFTREYERIGDWRAVR